MIHEIMDRMMIVLATAMRDADANSAAFPLSVTALSAGPKGFKLRLTLEFVPEDPAVDEP